MVYIHVDVNEAALEYKRTGDWMLRNAEAEFDKGDLAQASEKAWGSVSQYLKALATERGWAHDSHGALAVSADKLAKETGNSEIRMLFSISESLHANFYEASRDAESVRQHIAVRQHIDRVHEFIVVMRNIPCPEQAPRKTHIRERPFFRNKAGRL